MTKLKAGEMLVLFSGKPPKSTADATYTFLPNKNFFYMTGLKNSNFKLAVYKKNDGTIETLLFIEKANYDIEKWHGRKLTNEQATVISGIETIKYIEEFDNWMNGLIYNSKVSTIYLDLERVKADEDHSFPHKFGEKLMDKYLFLKIATAHPILAELRTLKSNFEVSQVQKAVDITKEGLESILKILKPGVMEYQVEATFAHSIRMNGADGNSFPTIAVSGADSFILHYVDNNKAVPDNSLILLDLGAQYNQYAADITRTYPSNGTYTTRQKEIYDIVLKAQESVIEIMKPGLPIAELNKTSKKVLLEELTRIGLIKSESELVKYCYHGVSHFLGLDVHDIGNEDRIIEPGMIFTVEPGVYIAEEEIGIRIEDNILVTKDGNINLSKDIIKTTEDIEAFMKKFAN